MQFPLFLVIPNMSRRRRKADDLTNLTAAVGREDGGDPREFHIKPWNKQKQAGHKGQQLCTQVEEALRGVFTGCADPVVQQLSVASVEPAPHTGRLLVMIVDAFEVVISPTKQKKVI